MLKKLKNNKGFTIIEVMIVLAVAALIILIVLLAVPALQRSSRNTSIKNDASAVEAAVTNYENNNNGVIPKFASTSPAAGTAVVGATATDTNAEKAKVQGSTVVCVVTSTPTSAAASATAVTANATGGCSASALTPGVVAVLFGQSCSVASGTATCQPNNRSTSTFYVTETGSGNQLQVLES